MILSGELGSGQRLNEQHLATQFGVSRGPVREALRALERASYVTSIPNLGMFVRQIGIEEALELYELRAVIFGFGAGRVAERASDEQKAALADIVAEMDAAIAAEDRAKYYRLNFQFHDAVMEYSGHLRAGSVYESLLKESHLFRKRSLEQVSSMQDSNSEHRKIVIEILAGNGARARAAAEKHHEFGKKRWLGTFSG
jgi:DNA-binding GntR family transcriptional regulator